MNSHNQLTSGDSEQPITVIMMFESGGQIKFKSMKPSVIDMHINRIIHHQIRTASLEPGVPEVIGDVIVKVMDH